MRSLIWISLVSLLLTACATMTPTSTNPTQRSWPQRETALNAMHEWQLNGKISVQTANDSGSATIDWAQNQQSYAISLLGPLGAGGLKLNGLPGHVTLTMADGKVYRADSPEQLLAQKWGFDLPVSHLHYWIRGLPVPGIAAQNQFDSYHRLTDLTQDGWHIQYLSYTTSAGIELPQRMTIISAQLKTKIVINEWNTHIAH